jgi:hypothetical protein
MDVSRRLLKAGSFAASAGAVLLVAATMMHPMSADPSDAVAAFAEYAADRWWVGSHLGQFFGVALIVAGLNVLSASLQTESSARLAQFGWSLAVAALALAGVLQAVDGVALKLMVDRWAETAGPDKQVLFHAAFAVRQIEIGLAAFLAMLFGAAVSAFGLALSTGTVYPPWLGWLAIACGLGTLGGGVAMAFTGFSALSMAISMTSNLLMLVWVLCVGVFLWRRAQQMPERLGSR